MAENKITVVVKGREFEGTYTIRNSMLHVQSIYGSLTVHGNSKARAEETLKEIVRANKDITC